MAQSIVSTTGKPILDQRKGKLQPWRQDQCRQMIQVNKIIHFVQDHVLNGTEVAATRLHAGLKLINKVLPDAIPDAVTNNLQANTALALSSLTHAQLQAMAMEMLANQGVTVDAIPSPTPSHALPLGHAHPDSNTLSGHAHPDMSSLNQTSPSEMYDTSNVSQDSLGGYGKGGVGVVEDGSQHSPAQQQSNPYPYTDELG